MPHFRCEDNNCNGSATLQGVSFFNINGGSVSEDKTHNTPIDGRKVVTEALAEFKSRPKMTVMYYQPQLSKMSDRQLMLVTQ